MEDDRDEFEQPSPEQIVEYSTSLRHAIFDDDSTLPLALQAKFAGIAASYVANLPAFGIPRSIHREILSKWTEALMILAYRGESTPDAEALESLVDRTFDAIDRITPPWESEE